jgi:2-oxoglutarate ferredoxin oxidoreductase subunit alpha
MSTPSFLTGNQAIAEGAIAAGCRFYAGYPITPSSEIAEVLSKRLPEVGGVFVQMEDEIASIAAVLGASLGGVKSATATSGPGFSLMQENLGFGVVGEIPAVIVNVQRVGPSTGLPTKVAQGDVMQARWGTHGDHPIIVLYPSSAQEAYELAVRAFNLSERFRTPVILLSDAVVAGLREKVEIPSPEDLPVLDRPQPTVPPEEYQPFDYTTSTPPPLAPFGSGYRYHVTGLLHTVDGAPTEDTQTVEDWANYIERKLSDHLDEILDYDTIGLDDAETIVIAYGCTARAAEHAVHLARDRGMKVGFVKLKTIWPFADDFIAELAAGADRIIVPELNLGQIGAEVRRAALSRAEVVGINRVNGSQITPDEIIREIEGANR